MNKITKKLILSAVSMMFAIVALGSSTFAWFTLTQQSSVATINLNIDGSEGIRIAISSPDVTQADVDAYIAQGNDMGQIVSPKFFSGFGESVAFVDIEKAVGETTAGSKQDGTPGYGNDVLDNILLTALAGSLTSTAKTNVTDEAFSPVLMKNNCSVVDTVAPRQNIDYINFKLWFVVETVAALAVAEEANFYVVPEYTVSAVATSFVLKADATMDPDNESDWKATKSVGVSAANALRITTVQTLSHQADGPYGQVTSYSPEDTVTSDLGAYAEKDAVASPSRAHAYYHNTYINSSGYLAAWNAVPGTNTNDGIILPRDSASGGTEDEQKMNAMFGKTKVASELDAPDKFPVTVVGKAGVSINFAVIGIDYFIYLDGWDSDCFDALYTQSIDIDMLFFVENV